MTEERDDFNLRIMIERMLRAGSSERDINRAVREAAAAHERLPRAAAHSGSTTTR